MNHQKLLSAAAAVCLSCAPLAADTITGPSSSQSPYLIGTKPGVVVKSVVTTGDAVDGYRMVGIPDGLGAFDNGDGTFTVLMNHELGSGVGIVRAHGTIGAFVSKWTIRKDDLTVLHGEDLMQNVATWNGSSWNPPAKTGTFNRFCSADLAAPSAFYDAASNLGYDGRIFLNGEESGTEGRAMAHLMDGTSYQLPHLGRMAFENVVANSATGAKTVVATLDDGTGGQVYFYIGTKANSGNPVEKAGLANGNLYGLKVTGYPAENGASGIPSGTRFTLYNHGNVSAKTGSTLNSESVSAGVTTFLRPEDGSWDPNNSNHFYFVTTDSFDGKSRLWRLRFDDINDPTAGGAIDMLLNGTEGQKMMDNIAINRRGQIVIQEDPGNQTHLAKIWRYSIAKGTMEIIAEHDPARFAPGGPGFLTQDEESSGVIDVSSILGEGWFLLVQQAHYNIGDTELVEGGQLLVLHFPPGWK